MSSTPEILPRRLFPLPERLAASPGSLVCLALLVNAAVQPYLGYFHDARLYAFYLQARLEPTLGFDQDLYLTYGSQDRYSLFSLVMFPLVKFIGLDAGFFLAYVVSKALLFWGMARLVRVLARNDLVTGVAMVVLAASAISFGGNEIFHVNESFLTPRLGAAALVLLGLERMLAGKRLFPAALFLGGLALHPLMGVAGVLTWALWWAFGRFTRWQLAGLFLLACGASAGVLAYEPLGTRVFGHMDDNWRAITLRICYFIRPDQWTPEDWMRLAVDCGLLVAGAFTFARHCARFLWAVLAAGSIGLAWSCVAVETHYLLLIQTSPYRMLWVLEFLAIPLGVMAVADLWQRGTVRARAGSLALLLLLTHEWMSLELNAVFLFLLAGSFGVFVVWHRGLRRRVVKPDWMWLAARHTFLTACGLLVVYGVLVLGIVFTAPPTPEIWCDPASVSRMLGPVFSRLLWCIAACYAAAGLAAVLGSAHRFRIAVGAATAVYLALGPYLLQAPWYLERFVPADRHNAFVADFLEQHRDPQAPVPCVYWETDLARVWFRLRANSYITVIQLSGSAFNRETASEGKRRVHLVARFEAEGDRLHPKLRSDRLQQFWDEYRDCSADAPPPTCDDLWRLVREEKLDYAVLPVGFDGRYCASDGYFYIYDCRRLREQARQADAMAGGPTALAATEP